MARHFLTLLSFVICQNVFSQNNDINELTKLNQDWADLSMKKDTVAFAKIFADDFVLISPNGAKRTKWDVIKNTVAQNIKSITIDSLDVRLPTNEIGIVTCYTTFVLVSDNKEVTGRNCYQDIYIKRKNRWFALSAHVTLLSMK